MTVVVCIPQEDTKGEVISVLHAIAIRQFCRKQNGCREQRALCRRSVLSVLGVHFDDCVFRIEYDVYWQSPQKRLQEIAFYLRQLNRIRHACEIFFFYQKAIGGENPVACREFVKKMLEGHFHDKTFNQEHRAYCANQSQIFDRDYLYLSQVA